MRLARSNAIAIESFLFGQYLSLPLCLQPHFFRFFRSTESPTPLLVHLGSWCYAIYGHEEKLLWLDLAEKIVDV